MHILQQLGHRSSLSVLVLVAVLAFGSAHAELDPGGSTGATLNDSSTSLAVFRAFLQEHDASYYAEDGEFHIVGAGEPFIGRVAIAEALATLYGGAFTDTRVEIRSLLADGPRVVLEFVYNGTNTAEFMGLPATDQRVTVPMLGIYEVHGDHIQVGRLYFDQATMMRQLGHTH
jgi:steroid delta-isomerase-like uncharacterized protein